MKLLQFMNKKRETLPLPKTNRVEDLIPNMTFKDGLLITDNLYVGFIEVFPINFQLKNEREKKYIIDKYGELLKKVRIPYSIFTIAKRADAKNHLEMVEGLLETETNENVKDITEEYIKYVQNISFKSAVRRRWIVAMPYTGITKGKNYIEIKEWLYQKMASYKEGLAECLTDCQIIYDDDMAAEIIYELFNMRANERRRMPE